MRPTHTVFRRWLCSLAAAATLSAPALAAPFFTTYTGTIATPSAGSNGFPEVTVGETYTVTFVFDNGGSSANLQTWSGADLTCTIWRFNNARNVIYAQDLSATPPQTVSDSATTNASGVLTGFFSNINTINGLPNSTTFGLANSSYVNHRWFANNGNSVFYANGQSFMVRDVAGGVLMAPSNWTAPAPFTNSDTPTPLTGGCAAVPTAAPAAVAPVPSVSNWALLMLGVLTAGLGWRARSRKAQG